MSEPMYDVVIVGAGPVGLMCAYLGRLCGLHVKIVDKSDKPLEVGRADALNARTLQLLEIAGLFSEIYPKGKTCNTSSVWRNSRYLSRESEWWESLEGCFHKHFLMIGQANLEQLLDKRLAEMNCAVKRKCFVKDIKITEDSCLTTLETGECFQSRFIIGADGARSFVRDHFKIPFEVTRPQMRWAVIDGVIETDFEKVPEIIVFQSETSDVAWIPREGDIDRFYIRMDKKNFKIEEAIEKINHAMRPYTLRFKEIRWFSHFSVKESVAEHFFVKNRVFLAGDSCHIHSVNGGQGLNTGIADAFNLMWRLHMVQHHKKTNALLKQYEGERKPVALSVIQTSGELVRATKYSEAGTHAKDYVRIVRKRAGNITGMGIRYGGLGLSGTRLFDIALYKGKIKSRLYQYLDYSQFTLLLFGEHKLPQKCPPFVKCIHILQAKHQNKLWTDSMIYKNQALLVRPDGYIDACVSINALNSLLKEVG